MSSFEKRWFLKVAEETNDAVQATAGAASVSTSPEKNPQPLERRSVSAAAVLLSMRRMISSATI